MLRYALSASPLNAQFRFQCWFCGRGGRRHADVLSRWRHDDSSTVFEVNVGTNGFKAIAHEGVLRKSPILTEEMVKVRATSMTSNGMRTHYVPQSPIQREGIVSESATGEASNKRSDPAITGDWSNFRPHPAMVTPFSLTSQTSSTPGTLEVNEATASPDVTPARGESIALSAISSCFTALGCWMITDTRPDLKRSACQPSSRGNRSQQLLYCPRVYPTEGDTIPMADLGGTCNQGDFSAAGSANPRIKIHSSASRRR